MQTTSQTAQNAHPPPAATGYPALWRSPAVLPALILVITGVLVGTESSVALAIVLLEGALALGVLASAVLAGMWLVPLLGLGRERWADRLMLGAGLGIGGLSLLVLGLGALGWLRTGCTVAVVVLAVAALARVALDVSRTMIARRSRTQEPGRPADAPVDSVAVERSRREAIALSGFHYLWLLTAPFLAVTVLAVTLPPGILWSEEAWGYDVLEYHLAVPKEFFEAGRIFFMPYNVYSNFPLNSEMLSLLLMSLRGDPVEAAFAAQTANLGLAVVFVMAAWWTGRLYSPFAGVTAGVLAASTPWLGYLAGVAFVEPGMLALGMLALGAMLRAVQPDRAGGRWALAAGLLAGLACGYKYTAIPLIAAPLALVPLFADRPWAERCKLVVLFGFAAGLAFSPWLIRNQINTGNPVFPLAYDTFGAKPGVWDDELQARWQRGHGWAGAAIAPGESPLRVALSRTVLEPRLGPLLWILAIVGAVARRDRWTVALTVLLAIQVVVWFAATHLFARFAVVMLLPLFVLAARLAQNARSFKGLAAISVALLVASTLNIYEFTGLYYSHTRLRTGPAGETRPMEAHGHLNWFVKGEWPGVDYLKIVNILERNPRVMFVGEARTFYVKPPRDYAVVFSRHPLAEAVARLVGAEPATSEPAGGDRPAAASEFLRVSDPPPGASAQVADGSPATQDETTSTGYGDVVRWMAGRGVTHLLVHWLELDRLQRTYGLDRELTPELFVELESVGLTRVGDFMLEENGIPYATLYEVPHE